MAKRTPPEPAAAGLPPIASSALHPATTRDPAQPPTGATPSARILVVDDEHDVADALRYTLEDEGYAVVAVADSEAAIAQLDQASFDAIVLDAQLKGASGLDFAKRLRADDATSRIPIIVFSGWKEADVRAVFPDYDAFVNKGDDLTGLDRELAGLLGQTRRLPDRG